MNFRTVVQDGLIVVNTHGALPDGTPVEISVSRRASRGKASIAAKAAKPRRNAPRHTPGFGMWSDREELGSVEAAVDRLRKLTRRRRVG